MTIFEAALCPSPGTRIIDLGGTAEIWQLVTTPLDITIVNLPGISKHEDIRTHHRITFLEGDATALPQFADNSFDIAFSNSVIEHVGGPAYEARFARELRRLAPAYWVQTPSIWFPLEAHTGIPFWWLLPRFIRSKMHRRWQRTLPEWNEMVAGTVVISKRDFRSYFPDADCGTERVFGIPKSYFAVRSSSPAGATVELK